MDIKDFAKMLDGRRCTHEITSDEEKIAAENEFVVVFGYFVDRCELRGAVHDEIDCYDGGIIKAKGLPKPINAIWCPADKECSWSYETDMPHEEFNIFDGDELFCIGIVIDIKAARLQMTEHERLVELLSECKPIMERILDDDWYENEISDIADYLLSCGVVVPPCKVGDVLYIADKANNIICMETVRTFFIGHPSYSGNMPHLEMIRTNKHDIPIDDFGKRVFLTKEAAETALKK